MLREKIKKSVIKIFKTNMGLRPKEKVLILTDVPSKRDIETKDPVTLEDICQRAELARLVYEIAVKNFSENTFQFFAYGATWQHSKELYPDIANLFLDFDVLIAITTFSLSHTNARIKACKEGVRIASMPGATKEMFYPYGPLDVNYQNMKKDCLKWKRLLDKSKVVKITTKNGTNIKITLGNEFFVDTGIYVNKGDFGNLPAGEVDGTPTMADGKFIVPKGWMCNLDEDMVFTVENGRIVDLKGGGLIGNDLKNKLGFEKRTPNQIELKRGVIAELGIGTNPRAKRPDNILEAEKIKGTIHIAIGNNTSYPGGNNDADIHLDFIIPKPTMILDGKEVIRNGNWLI